MPCCPRSPVTGALWHTGHDLYAGDRCRELSDVVRISRDYDGDISWNTCGDDVCVSDRFGALLLGIAALLGGVALLYRPELSRRLVAWLTKREDLPLTTGR
jgi:hypothetical protein